MVALLPLVAVLLASATEPAQAEPPPPPDASTSSGPALEIEGDDAPVWARAAAMNCALVLAALYAIQGLGIVAHFLGRFNTPRPLRIAIAATAVLALVTSTMGVVLAVALPILGVTEIWIPYRKTKGDGA